MALTADGSVAPKIRKAITVWVFSLICARPTAVKKRSNITQRRVLKGLIACSDCAQVCNWPNPFCRHASNTATATALERFRLRCPVIIGKRSRWLTGKDSRRSGASPRVSLPNTSQSPGRNVAPNTLREPCVVIANMRPGAGLSLSSNACQLAWRWSSAYS